MDGNGIDEDRNPVADRSTAVPPDARHDWVRYILDGQSEDRFRSKRLDGNDFGGQWNRTIIVVLGHVLRADAEDDLPVNVRGKACSRALPKRNHRLADASPKLASIGHYP